MGNAIIGSGRMTFEWDDNKEQINIKKHGMDFETASRVFDDENRIEIYDDLHSDYEDRYITIGMIDEITCIAMVVYTERGTDVIRIISARKATPKERRKYYDYS
jgi:Uncharacterized protein conserved in bacteria